MEEEDVFTPKHERLSTISYWANIASRWVLTLSIAYAILIALTDYIQTTQSQANIGFALFGPSSVVGHDILPYISIIFSLLYSIMKGIVYYLALKGISLGLDMIIETDINYRSKGMEENKNE